MSNIKTEHPGDGARDDTPNPSTTTRKATSKAGGLEPAWDDDTSPKGRPSLVDVGTKQAAARGRSTTNEQD